MRRVYFYFFSLVLFAALLTIKVSNIIGYSVNPTSEVGFVSDLSAKEDSAEEPAKPADKKESAEPPKEEKPAEAKPTEGEGDKKEGAGEKKEGEGEKKEGEGEKKPVKEKELVASTEKPKSIDLSKQEFSPAEIDVLQNLAKRREELDRWNQDIVTRENVLTAATEKVNGKIKELSSLKLEVGHLLFEYNKKEDEKIASLVKIYQNMKPKEAAAIFEQLDMPILLEVVTKMKEANAALILAQMDPTKAKELTIQLAQQKRLPPMADPQPDPGTDAAANDSAAPAPAGDTPAATAPAADAPPAPAVPTPAAAPAADSKPADTPPTDSKTPDAKPADAKPADSKPADSKADDKPATPEAPPAAEPPK